MCEASLVLPVQSSSLMSLQPVLTLTCHHVKSACISPVLHCHTLILLSLQGPSIDIIINEATHFLSFYHTSSICHSLSLTPLSQLLSLTLSFSFSITSLSLFHYLSLKNPSTRLFLFSLKLGTRTIQRRGKNQCGRSPKDYNTYWAEFLYLTA